MLPPRPRQQVEYQKPRRINTVSVTLTLLLALTVWVGISFWPLFILRSNVKNELAEAVPRLWKLNLRPEGQARVEAVQLRKYLIERLRKIGVKDQKLDVVLERNKQRVAMSALYSDTGRLHGLQRKFAFTFSPRVETDAGRVDW